MRGGVAAKRRCRGARIEAVRDCRRRLAAGEVNAHLRIGLDVAKPLRAGTETGDHDVAARRRMINHLQHDVATTPGLAPNVLEHQKSRSQQNTKPDSVEPDRRPNEPPDAEQGCTGTSGWIPAPGGHRTHLSSQPVRRVPNIRYSVSMVDRSGGISPSSTSVGPVQQRSRRITRRGMPLAVAPVVPTTRNPARSNIDFVPTNAMVRSIRPGGSTG